MGDQQQGEHQQLSLTRDCKVQTEKAANSPGHRFNLNYIHSCYSSCKNWFTYMHTVGFGKRAGEVDSFQPQTRQSYVSRFCTPQEYFAHPRETSVNSHSAGLQHGRCSVWKKDGEVPHQGEGIPGFNTFCLCR